MNKIEMYGTISEELGVVMAFSKLHEELGFPKLVPAKSRGFDIDDIEYKGRRVTLEFEYTSDNFINHEHVLAMRDERDYVLVCYEDNCDIVEKVKKLYGKNNLTVIELKDYIEVKYESSVENNQSIEYIVLSYNTIVAGKIPIEQWKNTNVYGVQAKFKNDYIAPGSKILFKQNDEIVAGCDVVCYKKFERPNSNNEWNLFANLLQYPIGLYDLTNDEIKESFANGYIFYDNFTLFEKHKIKFSEKLPERQIGNQGMIKISKEEYEYLIGKKYQFERSVYMSYIGRDGQKYETLEQVVLADKKYKMIEEQN